MRILYFEDDVIDQKLFMRASKNITNLSTTYYQSCLGLSTAYINTYDGIIVDQYLQDCSAIEFQNKDIKIPIAVLSASESLNGSAKGFIGIWQKPIKQNILEEILKKMFSTSRASSISLEYINELIDNNEEERQELLKLIYASINENNKAFEQYDSLAENEIQQHLHKQKSKIGLLYLEDLHKKIDVAESRLKNGEHKNDLLETVLEIKSDINKVLQELQTYIKI